MVTYKGVAAKILMVDCPGFDKQILSPGDYQRAPVLSTLLIPICHGAEEEYLRLPI